MSPSRPFVASFSPSAAGGTLLLDSVTLWLWLNFWCQGTSCTFCLAFTWKWSCAWVKVFLFVPSLLSDLLSACASMKSWFLACVGYCSR